MLAVDAPQAGVNAAITCTWYYVGTPNSTSYLTVLAEAPGFFSCACGGLCPQWVYRC